MTNHHFFQSAHALQAYSGTRQLWDTPLFESKSFVAVPSVGALVQGWLLVVPRLPTLSLAELSEGLFDELESFLAEITPILEETYGSLCVFEHGPTCVGSGAGCGVDHAHLHLLPTQCDLRSGVERLAPFLNWHQVSSLQDVRSKRNQTGGYWFFQQPYPAGPAYIGSLVDGEPPSQLFRKVIAEYLGNAPAYDWKTSAGEAQISATVARLATALLPA